MARGSPHSFQPAARVWIFSGSRGPAGAPGSPAAGAPGSPAAGARSELPPPERRRASDGRRRGARGAQPALEGGGRGEPLGGAEVEALRVVGADRLQDVKGVGVLD